ncbi:unnamed protein product [Dibothriocephalus latus]|uniref:Uncharacterized protein n=1 Tax=Dibothriocephalus latus TaxID=60516 RepID=A0A3P7LUI1_DIBLA|nr:unnamed protein product [Dibothriocephalus latus]
MLSLASNCSLLRHARFSRSSFALPEVLKKRSNRRMHSSPFTSSSYLRRSLRGSMPPWLVADSAEGRPPKEVEEMPKFSIVAEEKEEAASRERLLPSTDGQTASTTGETSGSVTVPCDITICVDKCITPSASSLLASNEASDSIEVVLQRLESLFFQHHRPKFWARYVVDTFVVIKRDQVLTFEERLDSCRNTMP